MDKYADRKPGRLPFEAGSLSFHWRSALEFCYNFIENIQFSTNRFDFDKLENSY